MMSSFVLRVTTKAHFLIIAAIGVSLPADNPRDPASKKDLDGLQGSWKLVSAMRDGEALPKDKVKKTTIVIKDDTFLFPDLAEYATRGGDDQARREDKAKADGCDLDRQRSDARHLRTGRRPLQGLLRPDWQATTH